MQIDKATSGAPHRIVIVGGGAGGLELATRLGRKFGRRGTAEVTLIDSKRAMSGSPSCTRLLPGAWISVITRCPTWRRRTGMDSVSASVG